MEEMGFWSKDDSEVIFLIEPSNLAGKDFDLHFMGICVRDGFRKVLDREFRAEEGAIGFRCEPSHGNLLDGYCLLAR
jgi:hypothetical protein